MPLEYENTIGMKFRLIPPGEFLMGSTPEEIEAALTVVEDQIWIARILSEAPQHRVVRSQPVYVAETEVTQAQYELVMGTNPSHFAESAEGSDAVGGLETSNHPVEMVSWNDAAEFCENLSRQEEFQPFYSRSGVTVTALEGTGYRLPTEAEWEHACRAGTTTWFSSGNKDEDLSSVAWWRGNAGGKTHPVGEMRANPFGLSDVHGNVWEWVQDSWDPESYGTITENTAIDPYCPFDAGSQRVFHGGGMSDFSSLCRSSSRFASPATHRLSRFGFRVVLTVDAVREAMESTETRTVAGDEARDTDVAPARTETPLIESATDE